MRLSISKEYLNESIQHVSKAVSSRTTIPILAGIKIDATPTGVALTASDTDISIQSFIPVEADGKTIAQIAETGSIVLPAKFFGDMIKKLPSEHVEIHVRPPFHATIRSGSSEIQMVGLDPEEYPQLPLVEEKKVISIPSDLLKAMVRQTSFCVSTSETTPILTGILWTVTDNGLKFIACDRHRLAERETPLAIGEGQHFSNIAISGKTLNELSKILPDSNELTDIVVSDNQVLFRLNNLLFYSRILDGTYPDTSKLIPKSHQSTLVVQTRDLVDAIDRAYLLSREEKSNVVKMTMMEDGTIEISSSSTELGRVTETIDAEEFTGERLKISFNSKYMLDALRSIDSAAIRLGFTGAMSPIIIEPVGDIKLLQLILPYRTTN
ncbi:DNA polymerase III subunit beta [Gorillibacterium massiliense]|uniref:DNA polymerase III subunit beta n=1 Tax=Gorillibacterium massiliense TaxID=1280390 RepID=UPI0004B80B1E|nr:DNA polymerase III subunit beta [Gorillibacterium massiliense]